jgi:hypothetical protein
MAHPWRDGATSTGGRSFLEGILPLAGITWDRRRSPPLSFPREKGGPPVNINDILFWISTKMSIYWYLLQSRFSPRYLKELTLYLVKVI